MSGSTAHHAASRSHRAAKATAQWGRTQCPYCGVGCGLLVQIQAGEVVRVKGDPDHPANFGEVCAKAVMLPRALNTPDRLLYPHLRPAGIDADPRALVGGAQDRSAIVPQHHRRLWAGCRGLLWLGSTPD